MEHCALGALLVESRDMGLLTFGLNVTLDGCIDHTQGIVDDELHDYWTQLMDQSGAMLFGRNTYELMEGAWPAVARDEKAPRAMREWAQRLEAKAKYVVSGSRSDFRDCREITCAPEGVDAPSQQGARSRAYWSI
jgi:dihydrofolate reductase